MIAQNQQLYKRRLEASIRIIEFLSIKNVTIISMIFGIKSQLFNLIGIFIQNALHNIDK